MLIKTTERFVEEVQFMADAADAVRKIAMEYFRSPLSVEDKADNSPVTIADRAIERSLRSRITERFPDHGIFGEEEAPVNLSSLHLWVVDPIDGTKSFVTGHPLFGGLMALLQDGTPCLGQIDMPALNERWQGCIGVASTFNGSVCHTSKCTRLAEAFVYTTNPFAFEGEMRDVFGIIADTARLVRFGGDCYSYGLLASGHCDLVIETGLQPYDYLPLVQIIEGAGGVITDWAGQPLHLHSEGHVVAAATPELHAETLVHLASLLDRTVT
ncbi:MULTISPECIES: inositol monophosphatase family protein [Roseobacteraceae]|uniref:Histidinol-phosphatase n=1 Tax=Pseudosulfitobacter pseudonitzschiae TaxID=1402135 RepID=A0A221K835_9RHOB|nr:MULTISPECIES: inositol monophosphatase family protein [Roseobacteraceae]ASM75146.1 histidinol-phosphatase [Pseudosulfitobacter pseudonitzschiae]